MRAALLYNPKLIIERLALSISRKKRFMRLKNTSAYSLTLGHIDSLELLELVKAENPIKVIYDIGANVGTWSILSKAIFPKAKVFAFEPLQPHIEEFYNNTKDLENIILYPYALGSKKEMSKINISSFSDSSSLLPSTQLLNETYNISTIDAIEIQVLRLDDLFDETSILIQPDLIKLDIQGYELEALKGAEKILKKTKYIIMEVSFLEYYKGQPLFEEVIVYMNKQNFKVKAFGQNTPIGQNLTQIDILFANNNL